VSHHVHATLPDGRHVQVDYRQPVVRHLRVINDQMQRPIGRRDYARLGAADVAAAAWLDEHPALVCSDEQIRDGTCTTHD